MRDSRVAVVGDAATARSVRWAATWRRWLEALDRFLEKGFRLEDVETGC